MVSFFFLIWKLISGQKEIDLHRGQICVVSQHRCNYTVDQTDAFVFHGVSPPLLMSLKLPGSPAAAVFISREQGDVDGWSRLAIIPPSPSSNSSLGWTGAIQTNGWAQDSGTQASSHGVGMNGYRWGGPCSCCPLPCGAPNAPPTFPMSAVKSWHTLQGLYPFLLTIFPTRNLSSPDESGHCKLVSRYELMTQSRPFQHKVQWIFT